ncbi:hypothetical protein ACHAXA_010098 [Cyclostephanos tholiformis]|uniref:Uncharacterized protein n=1 Tax=Cyclostephanos tholiformis TaxID=382380 RepID=A0ABD3RT13_9STRA
MNEEESGIVRIYHLDEDGMKWDQIGDGINGDAAKVWLGHSVSLSANGMTVVIGAPKACVNGLCPGGVMVYRIDSAGLSWEQLGDSIYGDTENDKFGASVDVSHDGNTIAIGSPQEDVGPGYVRVFSLEGGDYISNTSYCTQISQNFTGDAKGDCFGSFVSLSDDGKTITVSAARAKGENAGVDSGHVRVYRMSEYEPEWKKVGEDIDGEKAGETLGYSVSL